MHDRVLSPWWRPVAHVAITRSREATQIVEALHRQGYQVFEHADGVELVGALADLIDRRQARQPALIVADLRLRGCLGTTIARGLHELGITTPVILIATDEEVGELIDRIPMTDHLWTVDPAVATRQVPELAREFSPLRLLEREPPRLQA